MNATENSDTLHTMKSASAFKVVVRLGVWGGLCFFALVLLNPQIRVSFSGGTKGKHIREQKTFGAAYRRGDTNIPVLAMDWFRDHAVYFCRVTGSGDVSSARDVGYAIQGGTGISSKFKMGTTERKELDLTLANLPAPINRQIPEERRIYISGVKSNRWFAFVYDRANIPPQVETLYQLTQAYLEWYVPTAQWRPNGEIHGMSQRTLNSFAIAQDTPTAVSVAGNVQVWDLAGKSATILATLDKIPADLWSVAAMSTDGKYAVIAGQDAVVEADWKTQAVRWTRQPVDLGNTYGASHRLLAIGDAGKSLFVAQSRSIERWNFADGKYVSTLASNASGVKLLQSSPNGGILLAGFGDNSFLLWETESDVPAFRFNESDDTTCAAISPDNQRIVLNGFGWRQLVVYDWPKGKREVVPLRLPYASTSTYGIFWSPDGDKVAMYVDTYPASVIVYESTHWRPVVQWPCGAIGTGAEFVFNKNGILFEFIDGAIQSLDVRGLKVNAE